MTHTATATVKTITEEELHYNYTEKILDKVKKLETSQANLESKMIDILDKLEVILFLIILLVFTTITLIILISLLIKKNKEIKAQIDISKTNNKETIELTEQQEEILNIIKENPEKAETIIKLLK